MDSRPSSGSGQAFAAMFMTLRVVLDHENRRGAPCGRPSMGRHKACPYIFGGMTPRSVSTEMFSTAIP
jgi:hypothetical protein